MDYVIDPAKSKLSTDVEELFILVPRKDFRYFVENKPEEQELTLADFMHMYRYVVEEDEVKPGQDYTRVSYNYTADSKNYLLTGWVPHGKITANKSTRDADGSGFYDIANISDKKAPIEVAVPIALTNDVLPAITPGRTVHTGINSSANLVLPSVEDVSINITDSESPDDKDNIITLLKNVERYKGDKVIHDNAIGESKVSTKLISVVSPTKERENDLILEDINEDDIGATLDFPKPSAYSLNNKSFKKTPSGGEAKTLAALKDKARPTEIIGKADKSAFDDTEISSLPGQVTELKRNASLFSNRSPSRTGSVSRHREVDASGSRGRMYSRHFTQSQTGGF